MVIITLPSIFIIDNFVVKAQAPTPTPNSQTKSLLEKMTPEERVGQLFMVTFFGTDVSEKSQIYELITKYHIGSIVLLAKNDNITYVAQSPNDTIIELKTLINNLQTSEWQASQETQTEPITDVDYFPSYIPLFIGISQEGDGYPNDQILFGLTKLPNAMSLGATWQPSNAEKIGKINGKQLSQLGINLLLGPSLDILESTQLQGGKDLGTRTFGGDPYWVSEMGKAYIHGVHEGSDGKIAVVAKHFPGFGGSDRPPEEEVATIRKSLDELQSFDLAPFFAVTGQADTPEEITDALLTSHIRYQGLQGNIRATTRPVSFDPQAINLLMSLPELASWRANGGLMISDDLGSQAVKRFYEYTGQTYEPRRVALNAFLAGNDLLYITNDLSEEDSDPFSNLIKTLEFFSQKYREDTAFAQRVDQSVERIINLKHKIYGDFSFEKVSLLPETPSDIESINQIIFDIARQSATLISPDQADLDETAPDPPNLNDRIIFISDTRHGRQCSQCASFPLMDVNTFQEYVIRRYGPLASGQVVASNLSSYSLSDLQKMLDGQAEDLAIEFDINRANWIVFSMLDASDEYPSYQVLDRFLTERPDLFQQKRVIVFAFNAPYYLDATNISKLTAFYGMYSKIHQFVDVSAYLLFRELRPTGASPVSIQGINYNINEKLFPNPEQTIVLTLDVQSEEDETPKQTPIPLQEMDFTVGDIIPIKTDIILDHNGNPVPDGTPVNFIFSIQNSTSSTRQTEYTVGGVARTTYLVTDSGTLEVFAQSEGAKSDNIKFDIPAPELNTTPTVQITATDAAQPTPSQNLPTTEPALQTHNDNYVSLLGIFDWLIAMLLSISSAWVIYQLTKLTYSKLWGIRFGFLSFMGGVLGYLYLLMNLPGAEQLLSASISRSVLLLTFTGVITGAFIALLWKLTSK